MTNSKMELIKAGQFVLKIGPFSVRIESRINSVQQGIFHLYSDYPQLSPDTFCDFYVRVICAQGFRRFIFKQSIFALDQFLPFKPLPYAQAFPFFEWGLNWCIAGYALQYFIIHAAVVEKNGKALILPGSPGSGKSTLCAALINKGWRLLSDELTLIDCATGNVVPVPRPVSLKNESIQLVANIFPDNIFSPIVHDTAKGSVSLMKPPSGSVKRAGEFATPSLVIFPKFIRDSDLKLLPLAKSEAFMKLAELAFNYDVLGSEGFNVLAGLVENCRTFEFEYDGDFDRASACFEKILND